MFSCSVGSATAWDIRLISLVWVRYGFPIPNQLSVWTRAKVQTLLERRRLCEARFTEQRPSPAFDDGRITGCCLPNPLWLNKSAPIGQKKVRKKKGSWRKHVTLELRDAMGCDMISDTILICKSWYVRWLAIAWGRHLLFFKTFFYLLG